MDLSDLLSPMDAAAYLGVSRPRIYVLVNEGRITSQRVAGRLVFRRQDLDTWKGHKKPGRPRSPTSRRSLVAARAQQLRGGRSPKRKAGTDLPPLP